jgi:hypothetical protein
LFAEIRNDGDDHVTVVMLATPGQRCLAHADLGWFCPRMAVGGGRGPGGDVEGPDAASRRFRPASDCGPFRRTHETPTPIGAVSAWRLPLNYAVAR